MQIPPTPTPFIPDPNVELIDVPDFSLWDSAPEAIQAWNSASAFTVFFQALIIVGIAISIIMLIIHISGVVLEDDV